jgi:hypothetical protein
MADRPSEAELEELRREIERLERELERAYVAIAEARLTLNFY